MLCLIIFALLVILYPVMGFFPKYRAWFRASWKCAFTKIQGRPCTTAFSDEFRNTLLAPFAVRFPKCTAFFHRTFSVWAIVFVIVNVWLLGRGAVSLLNIAVYGTCNAVSAESCSLSGEACGAPRFFLSFREASQTGRVGEWIIQPVQRTAATIAQLPARFSTWNAEDYLPENPSYLQPYDETKETVLEVLDPGCTYCRALFLRLKEVGIHETHNLTYVVYPIAGAKEGEWKFQASYTLATYLEALKLVPLRGSTTPGDWALLTRIFTKDGKLQNALNMLYAEKDIPMYIEEELRSLGYVDVEITTIRTLAASDRIREALASQRQIVEDRIRTIRIPTLLLGGRRYDRALDVDTLRDIQEKK